MDIDKKTIKGASLFAGGVAFGTAGIKILASKDAKKSVYELRCRGSSRKGLCDEDSDKSSGKCGKIGRASCRERV